MLLFWVHICLQCSCVFEGFFPWVLWIVLLGLYLWLLFWILFCLIWVLLPQLFFPVHLLGIFISSHSLSVSVGLFFWCGSLDSSICAGHVFSSIQLPCVFWLDHLIHLHLRLLLIATYSLSFFRFCFPVSLTVFFPFLKADPFASLAQLVWKRCILWGFFCFGNSLFGLPFKWEPCWIE